jgi:hypothetical protein
MLERLLRNTRYVVIYLVILLGPPLLLTFIWLNI